MGLGDSILGKKPEYWYVGELRKLFVKRLDAERYISNIREVERVRGPDDDFVRKNTPAVEKTKIRVSEIEEQIESLVDDMKKYGYKLPVNAITDIRNNHSSIKPSIMVKILAVGS